jgi:hypothetical protein
MKIRKLNTAAATFLLGLLVCNSSYAEVDLSGTYDVGTLTPLERPAMYGDNLLLSKDQADAMAARFQAYSAQANDSSDPERSAPKAGGAVGGYNLFWIDRGEAAFNIDGKFRTSIITVPKNGRIPPMTRSGAARMQALQSQWRLLWRSQDLAAAQNTGTAWWLSEPGAVGPYDDIEQRPLAERCILGSRSTAGPPMLPNYYNNHKRIIQTPDQVMILTEMNHDARIIRLNAEHRPEGATSWLGDSVGRWEGDTLVVETKNFGEFPSLSGADKDLVVTEFFSRQNGGGLLYRFEIENPGVWTESWGGEYAWAASDGKLYEYACHEGNYALGNILRGARELEKQAAQGAD